MVQHISLTPPDCRCFSPVLALLPISSAFRSRTIPDYAIMGSSSG